MPEMLSSSTIDQLAKRLQEPSWLTRLRYTALKRHGELPWPHSGDEIWRRTDVKLLDPMQGFTLAEETSLLQAISVSDHQLASALKPLASEHLVVWADGSRMTEQLPPGVRVTDLAHATQDRADLLKRIMEIDADGLTLPEQKLTSLNVAFHHDDLLVNIPAGFSGQQPIRLVRLLSAKPNTALFPLTVIVVGQGSSVVLIHEDMGVAPAASLLSAPQREAAKQAGVSHVINGRIELVIEPQAAVHYVRIQRWDAGAREFLLQRATLHEGSQFTMVNIAMGALVSKAHVITKLLGPQAKSLLYGFTFGHGQQHVDQHTLQDHQAPHTMSDLLFKAALKDDSRMIYTGLIRIAKTAKQTDAYQANHNLLLSQHARAETIPMLEILADDVRCKHGATIGPVDEEQLFYLMSRGIPRDLAERLIVMGFVESVIEQIPFEPLQQRLRDELEGSLHGSSVIGVR